MIAASESTLISEAQLVLAEKRTTLASMRTGIAIVALPMSIIGLLVATSKYYDAASTGHMLIPLLLVCAGLIAIGGYLIVQSLLSTRRLDRRLLELKKMHPRLGQLIDRT
ncbi:MAG: hypothetical protein H0S85_08755 [Desulfovibrionaceae bacterium]|nr:hypothetical protein [Desulfovibrionaceae bacterium]